MGAATAYPCVGRAVACILGGMTIVRCWSRNEPAFDCSCSYPAPTTIDAPTLAHTLRTTPTLHTRRLAVEVTEDCERVGLLPHVRPPVAQAVRLRARVVVNGQEELFSLETLGDGEGVQAQACAGGALEPGFQRPLLPAWSGACSSALAFAGMRDAAFPSQRCHLMCQLCRTPWPLAGTLTLRFQAGQSDAKFQPASRCFLLSSALDPVLLGPAPEFVVVATLFDATSGPSASAEGSSGLGRKAGMEPQRLALAANRYYRLRQLAPFFQRWGLPPATPGFSSSALGEWDLARAAAERAGGCSRQRSASPSSRSLYSSACGAPAVVAGGGKSVAAGAPLVVAVHVCGGGAAELGITPYPGGRLDSWAVLQEASEWPLLTGLACWIAVCVVMHRSWIEPCCGASADKLEQHLALNRPARCLALAVVPIISLPLIYRFSVRHQIWWVRGM